MIDRLAAALSDRYRIERELGAGGMATVYLAEDLKHRRKVALKVLKPELAAVVGAERFLAEIETTANLQHPHILPLFDSGEADSFLFYVMPYVEGETLQDRLDREKQLPVKDAVAIASKVAGALHYAHDRGVVHRDIKPANILLSRGEPLVADFGIALAVGAAGGTRLTETGLSMGTPYYMSPEQATGDQHVGPASDIYALGCVLYEMLVGEPPFGGGTAQAILGKILAGAPVTPAAHRPSIPANVDAAIRQALEKVPADRFATADDFIRALGDPGFRHGEEAAAVSGPMVRGERTVTATSLAVAVVSLAVAAWALTRGATGAHDLGTPPSSPVRVNEYRAFSVSPDGSFLVYVAQKGATTELWYRSLTSADGHPIPGTEGAASTPWVSPDGTQVAFMDVGLQMKITGIDGGSVAPVASVTLPFGGTWTDDGQIFFGDDNGRRVRWADPLGGASRDVVVGGSCIHPVLLGAGDRVLCGGGADKFASIRELANPGQVRYWHRAGAGTGGMPALLRGADFRVVDGRYLVYMGIDGSIMATRIESADSLTVGRSVTLVPDVRREDYTGTGQFDIARDGTLVYLPGGNGEVGRLVRFTPGGRVEPMGVEEAAHLRFREDPAGRRLATVVEGLEQQELRVYDLATGTHQTLAEGSFINVPVWSPDGSRLAYSVTEEPGRESLVSRRLDSVEKPRELATTTTPTTFRPSMYLSDDSLLVGFPGDESAMIVSAAGIDSVGLSAGQFVSVSPDHRWVAFQASASGDLQIQPWPALNRRYFVATLGLEPQWRSSTELVWMEQSDEGPWEFHRVLLHPGADPPVGTPELIGVAPQFGQTPGWSWALGRDGDLIYLQTPAERTEHYFRVVPGWVRTMKRAVDEANR